MLVCSVLVFTHQKDACLAMSVINYLLDQPVSIYTVHDNFLLTNTL